MSNLKNLKKLLNVVEGFKSSGSSTPGKEYFVEDALSADQFQVGKIVRHGFPYEPTCMAFDPIQRLLAIGTKHGAIRLIGKPGVDSHFQHNSDAKVISIEFLVNEGALISVCSDDTVHLWRFTEQREPQLENSLQFRRERLSCCRLSVASKWLYLGTDKGNIHFVNIDGLVLSGYTINWNKAINTLQKTHPGSVIQLEENPLDSNKMLIGFETGLLVVWDLKMKIPEARFDAGVQLTSLCWHYEGKLFLSSHSDGSLMTWSNQKGQKPQSCIYPHATSAGPNEKNSFSKIKKVDWLSVKTGVPFVIFSGGTPLSQSASGGPTIAPPPSLTVMREKRLFVLQMDHPIVDFVPLCMSPYKCELEDPYAVAVLLQSDLVVIDLASPNFPWFENPYPMDIHESHVTCCHYLADCPPDLIPAFYSIGRASKNAEGLSTKEWPVKGGGWGANLFSYSELIITGHGDGSIKFWDASQMSLNVLYKLRTSKFFERTGAPQSTGPPTTPSNPPGSTRGDDSETASRASDTLNANVMQLREEHPYAIHLLYFCPDSRKLLAAGSTHVCLLNFSRRELVSEIPVLDVAIQYDVSREDGADMYAEDLGSSRDSSSKPSPATTSLPHQSGSLGSYSSNTSEKDFRVYIGIKPGQRRWAVGYQPELVCRLGCSEGGEPPPPITSICLNSCYQLLAVANECGIVVVDIAQKICVVSYGTPDLYGSLDPYTRAPRSPGMKKEDPKSPTLEKSDSASAPAVPPSKSATAALAGMVARGFSAQQAVLSHAPSLISTDNSSANHGVVNKPVNNSVSSDVEVAGDCLNVDLSAPNSVSSDSDFERAEDDSAATESKNGHHDKVIVRQESIDNDFEVLVSPPCSSKEEEDNESNSTPVNGEEERPGSQTPTPSNPSPERIAAPPRPPQPRPSLTGGGRNILKRMGLRLGARKSTESGNLSSRSPAITPDRVENVDLLDLTDDDLPAFKHRSVSVHPRLACPPDKQESHFSRSCSSSTSSLDNLLISREPIKCMQFAEAFTNKGESTQCYPSLWIGTSLGSVLVLNLLLPSARSSQPVSIVSSGSIFRLHGEIMAIGFLDGAGELLSPLSERWEDVTRTISMEETTNSSSRTSTQSSSQSQSRLTHQASRAGASSSSSSNTLSSTGRQNTTSSLTSASSSSPGFDAGASAGVDRQMVVMVSEAQARVVALPSQTCLYKKKFTDKSYVIRADILRFKENIPVLANYMANGRITVFSLPSLRVLLDVECVPLNERVARTFSFSQCGQAAYFSTPSELEKLTISAAMCDQLPQMLPELFTTGLEIPEPPKKGFLLSLFSVGTNALDRDQLFGGSTSGKPAYGTAQQISNSRMNQLAGQAGGAMGDIAKTRQALVERGERLGELDKTTQEMSDAAQAYSRSARMLAMKKEKESKRWGIPFLRD